MENVQRTIYGAYLQTCQRTQQPITIMPYTTLNQALNVEANYNYPPDINPTLNYYVIGVGGNTFTTGTGGLVPNPIQHEPTDANLYQMVPFVLCTLDNDLTPTEMANYRLRSLVTINGVQYVAYYAKLVSYTNSAIQMYNVSETSAGAITSTPFVPNATNLNPTPTTLAALEVNTVTPNYVSVSEPVQLIFTETDVTNFLNVCNIMFGSEYASIISEIGICSGVDITATGITGNNQPISYTEAVAVQINAFVNTLYAMYYSQSGLNVTYNVGVNEPMLTLQPQPA